MKNVPNYRIFTMDPCLAPYRDAYSARLTRVGAIRKRILGDFGVEEFANGRLYFGLHREEGGYVLREHLAGVDSISVFGDFNGWDRASCPMAQIRPGIWETHIPSMQPGSRYLYEIRSDGRAFDRVSPWARQVAQDEGNRLFSAVVPRDDYVWRNDDKRRKTVGSLFIYEAHIGMAREEGGIGSCREFARDVLPRIRRDGYTAVQLMAVQSHAYYASFGYHVTNPFAPACWFGSPEDMKFLIDEAHGLGLRVLLDVVHSHTSDNARDGICDLDGRGGPFCRGRHPAWQSCLYDYANGDTAHYLLSNLKYWLEEYHFDGFRFDGVGSMLYTHHGLEKVFTGYDDYFDGCENENAMAYLSMASELVHKVDPAAIAIVEDMSGYPGLCVPAAWGGLGMDYRLNMGVPDYWIKLVKDRRDEYWSVGDIWYELTRRRPGEKTIGYAESHDQALVGDKTLLFRMLDAQMYTGMDNICHTPEVDRGIALIKLIKLITASLAGDGYLNFMGNEFGHPEWIDFPREGNGWSTRHARRQWSLSDNGYLKYKALGDFDAAMLKLLKKYRLPARKTVNLWTKEETKLLAYGAGDLIFVFNFHESRPASASDMPDLPWEGMKCVFDTDEARFAGFARQGDMLPPRCARVYSR